MSTDLTATLVALLRSMRDAERDVFGGLDPDVRDRPMREGDWSPKDHQAHLTAWKARQANRYADARRGEEPAEMSERRDPGNQHRAAGGACRLGLGGDQQGGR